MILGNLEIKWGDYNPVFMKGDNSRPIEIIIGFTAGPIYFYPPILEASGIIKKINIDYKNLCDTENPEDPASFVVNDWYVDPEEADSDDVHQQVLTQTLFGETVEITREDINEE